MEKNGKVTATSPLSVWKDESTTGLETIRKILLAQHIKDSDHKLSELTAKYEAEFQEMQLKLQNREAEFASKFQQMQEDFQLRLDELKSTFFQVVTQVEEKSKKDTEQQQTDFGNILIQLGKEWSVANKNE